MSESQEPFDQRLLEYTYVWPVLRIQTVCISPSRSLNVQIMQKLYKITSRA